jgi:hypothetical protein
LNNPQGVAFDRAGNLYVANFNNNTIREFSPSGADLGVFASTGLSQPTYIAVVPDPSLSILASGNRAVLSWPVSGTNYTLQSTTNLPFPNWIDSTDLPIVHVLQCVLTNTIANGNRFYRLRSP